MFELLNGVYAELEDPAAPHFQLCLSIVETVSQVLRGAGAECWRRLERGGAGDTTRGMAAAATDGERVPPPRLLTSHHPFLAHPSITAQVKCSLLILDLPGAEELVCSLCATLLDAIK